MILPPAITLVTQATLLILSLNNGYCSQPLLQQPLTQQRTAGLAAGLQVATLPILVALPTAKTSAAEAAILQGECGLTHAAVQPPLAPPLRLPAL